MDHHCPHCGYLFKGSELWDEKQPVLKNYRLCPHCDIRLVVDRKTRYRQIVLLILTIVLLVIFFLPYNTAKIVTILGIIAILLYVFRANKLIKFEMKNNQ